MLRYHKQVYIDSKALEQLKIFNNRLNGIDWNYTAHCIGNIKNRVLNLESCLRFIKGLELQAGQIFEFYTDDTGDIIKVCYRIEWEKLSDIILVIGYDKEIITIYINSRTDKHDTLKKDLYIKGE